MGALKAMLHWAYQNEETGRVPPFPKLKQPEPASVEYLTMKQQEEVLAHITEIHRLIFRFAMEYGLRIGEVRAIMKDAIKDGRVSINKRAFSDNELRESTKTGDVRAYDLIPYAKEIIAALPPHLSPFVFVREDGKPYTNKNLNAIWRAACEKAGIRIKLYNAARHSLGCQLLDEGKDLSFVQEVFGHRR
jgi:integrase